MKASLKFRDEQKPLFRAKVPLSILGFPFKSGIVAGESKELTLNLATFFESGPSIKVAYRPNDSWNPFSLIVKTGSGPFGSPTCSSMLMSAEFNLLGRGNPTFMLHFKPNFGDFSIKKSQSSVFDRIVRSVKGDVLEDDSPIEIVNTPVVNSDNIPANTAFAGKKNTVLSTDSALAGSISSMLSGMEVSARTSVPVRGRATLNFRWGVRVPAELSSGANNSMARIAFQKIPFLVMNKIGIEHVDGSDSKEIKTGSDFKYSGNFDMADSFTTVKRHLEMLQAENSLLKKAVEDLRQEMTGVKSLSPAGLSDSGGYRGIERDGNKSIPSYGRTERRNKEKKASEFNGFSGKSGEGDVSEELKRALMGASAA